MQRILVRALTLGLVVAIGACVETDRTFTQPSSIDAQLRANFGQYGVVPIGAPPAQDSSLVALGRDLFFDKELSGNRDIACATCHEPRTSMTDGQGLAVG